MVRQVGGWAVIGAGMAISLGIIGLAGRFNEEQMNALLAYLHTGLR